MCGGKFFHEEDLLAALSYHRQCGKQDANYTTTWIQWGGEKFVRVDESKGTISLDPESYDSLADEFRKLRCQVLPADESESYNYLGRKYLLERRDA